MSRTIPARNSNGAVKVKNWKKNLAATYTMYINKEECTLKYSHDLSELNVNNNF